MERPLGRPLPTGIKPETQDQALEESTTVTGQVREKLGLAFMRSSTRLQIVLVNVYPRTEIDLTELHHLVGIASQLYELLDADLTFPNPERLQNALTHLSKYPSKDISVFFGKKSYFEDIRHLADASYYIGQQLRRGEMSQVYSSLRERALFEKMDRFGSMINEFLVHCDNQKEVTIS